MPLPDHLVLAACDLRAGTAWLEDRLGVKLAPGGRHVRMGTHNSLLRLAEGFYLELIAIDPDAPPPGRPRWFGLDEIALPPDRPRLIHWVARSDDIERDASAARHQPGEIIAMERGDFRWRITVPADGRLPGNGLLPSLIEWDVPFHPSDRLPDAGCQLMKLESFHPRPEPIRTGLAALGLAKALDLHACAPGEAPQMVAYVRCPRGLAELD